MCVSDKYIYNISQVLPVVFIFIYLDVTCFGGSEEKRKLGRSEDSFEVSLIQKNVAGVVVLFFFPLLEIKEVHSSTMTRNEFHPEFSVVFALALTVLYYDEKVKNKPFIVTE